PQPLLLNYAETLLTQSGTEDPLSYQQTQQGLADLYCQGYELPWEKLYGAQPPARISLPTYPFERHAIWATTQAAIPAGRSLLHPLLHANTSTLTGQRFASDFSGEEFFLRDHVLNGQKVLPAAAAIEMIRAAVERSVDDTASPLFCLELNDV